MAFDIPNDTLIANELPAVPDPRDIGQPKGGNAQKDREREREIRAEEKRRRDAAEREKQRQHDPNKPNDPKGGPSKSSQGIRDKDPYGLPDPLGEKPIPGGARPEPWVVVNVNIVIVRGLPFL